MLRTVWGAVWDRGGGPGGGEVGSAVLEEDPGEPGPEGLRLGVVADEGAARRPALVVLDDGSQDDGVHETRKLLEATARRQGVRTEHIGSEADGDVARYAAMLSTGTYAATYLQLGQDG